MALSFRRALVVVCAESLAASGGCSLHGDRGASARWLGSTVADSCVWTNLHGAFARVRALRSGAVETMETHGINSQSQLT
jgi:hypothetical protein